jgi:hypothetical protein
MLRRAFLALRSRCASAIARPPRRSLSSPASDPARRVRQSGCRLLRVLEPHDDMKSARDRWVRTPASARTDRRPGQPSVNAVSSVSSIPPTLSPSQGFRRINSAMSVSVLATAITCRAPSGVSTSPTREPPIAVHHRGSNSRSPSWQRPDRSYSVPPQSDPASGVSTSGLDGLYIAIKPLDECRAVCTKKTLLPGYAGPGGVRRLTAQAGCRFPARSA